MIDAVAFTGHRPGKLGGYKPNDLTEAIRLAVRRYIRSQPKTTEFISGMAIGFDQIAAKEVLNSGRPLIAAIPFWGQESRWPKKAQQEYWDILEQCVEVVCVSESEHYWPQYMQLRNEWMVDHANRLCACWNGSSGGTANCIRYARQKGHITLYNVWQEVIAMCSQIEMPT